MTLTSTRARQMADRVARATADVGGGPDEVSYVLRAYEAAMRPRETFGLSEDGPDFLRPGRTVLILAEDLRERDARVLAVGALAESRLRELRADAGAVERILVSDDLGAEGLEWWRALPSLGWEGVPPEGQTHDERLLEDLVAAPLPVQRATLSEALDQIRHAHLWTSPTQQRRAVAIARRVMHPLATRVDDTLARRYGWWLRRVGPALDRLEPEAARGRAPSSA